MTRTPPPAPARRPTGGLATHDAPPLDLPFRFMATGLAALAVMAVLYPLHIPLLLGHFYSSHLLTFVHVNTLGLIGAIVFGASYQMLPVVLQTPIASVRLGRLTWWLYWPALLAFVAGLSQGWTVVLAIGGSGLYLAVLLYVGNAAVTIARAPHRDAVAAHVALAALSLFTGASLGIVLALSKHFGFLGGLTFPILAAHVTLMVGGWVTPMIAGVAYRLAAMFTLTEDQLRFGWAWVDLALMQAGAWLLAASLLFGLGTPAAMVGACALLAGVAVFAGQLLRLYRIRRRRTFDIHIPFALAGLTWAILSLLLVLWGLVTGRSIGDPIWIVAGWLAIAGWAETSIQGYLYKIGTFLTWLNRYAPVAGRQRVPKLEDLYGRRTAVGGWLCWTVGVGLVAVATLSGLLPLAYVGSGILSLGALAFLVNAVRVGSHWRARQTNGSAKPASAGVGAGGAKSAL